MPDLVEDYVACRICMDSKHSYVSIFSQDLSAKVMVLADVQVEKNDGLPESICSECEHDLEKCYEFRIKVQTSDKKFRENMSQVDIEECNIKEESYMDEIASDNVDDKDSDRKEDDRYDDVPETLQKAPEETREAVPDPLNHVVVVGETERMCEMSKESLNKHDTMIDESQVLEMEEVAFDSLECMKEEAEAMDVDSNQRDPLGSSSVRRSGSTKSKHNLAESSDTTLNIGTDSLQPNVPVNNGMAGEHDTKEMHFMPSSSTHFLNTNNNESVAKPGRKQKTKVKRPKQYHVNIQKNFDSESFSDSLSQEDSSKIIESDNTSESDSLSSSASPKKLKFSAESQTKKRDPFCPVCNVTYETHELLKEHWGKKGFICRVCAAFFDSHLDLEGHFISHQTYNCKVCGEIFFCKIDLYQHKKTSELCNKQVLFECEMCNKKFSRERNLRSHKSVYHSENVENYECIVCRKSFKTTFLLTNHLRHSHVVHEYMECSICHTLCLGPERLKTHFKSHNEESQFPCPDCGEMFNKKSLLRSHMPSHDFTVNLCEICGESIRGKVAMKNHIDYKHQTGTFYCNLCNMKFDSKRKMVIHRKSHNRKYLPKPSICEICGKEFTSTQVLKNHLRIHFDERPFKCDICGASFKQKVSLRNHHRTHSDVGQYCCISCGKTFKWKQTYDKHIKNCKFKFECIPGSTSDVSDTALPISMIPPVCTSVDVKRENEILTGNSKPRIAPRITDCHQQLTGTKRQRRILPAIKHQERGINCVNNNEVNQPNQSLMLLPQTAFNLNTGILVKCVKFTPRNIVIPKNLANTLDSTPPLISFQNSATTFENFTLPSAPVDASSLKNYMCSVATGTQKESEQGTDLPDLARKDLDENHQKQEDEDPNEDKVRSIEQQKLLPNFMSTLSPEDAKSKNEYVVEKNQKQILSKQTHSQLISSSCIGNALKVPHVGLETVLLVNSAPKYTSSQNHGNSQDGDHLNKTSNFHDIQSKKTTICLRAEDSVQINNIKTTDMMTSARNRDNTLSSKVRAVDNSVKISSDTNSKQSTTAQPPKTESDTDSKEEYFCSVCNVDFGFPDRLEEHKSGKEFICRSCATIFNNHRDLEAHFYNHRKYMCKVCKKCFYVKSDLLHHKDTVASCKRTEVLKCRYCHNRFVHKSNLLAHIEVKHPNAETRPFNCNICDSSFKCQATLREHLKSCHTVYESVECDICHKILPGPSSLKTHVKNRHLQTESGVCPVCNKVLSSKHSVKLHMEIHTGEEKVCYICGAVVKGKKTFKQHIYHHENRKRYCSFCNLEFDSPTEKNRHYREKHSISKSCICEICGKEFKAREILRSHMLTHSDVKSFKCGVCGAAFKSKAVLKTHSRVHSDLRKYTCHLCGEAFRWKQTFDKHVLKCELSQSEARLKT